MGGVVEWRMFDKFVEALQQRAKVELLDPRSGHVVKLESLDVLEGRARSAGSGHRFLVSRDDQIELCSAMRRGMTRRFAERCWRIVGSDIRVDLVSVGLPERASCDVSRVCVVVEWVEWAKPRLMLDAPSR